MYIAREKGEEGSLLLFPTKPIYSELIRRWVTYDDWRCILLNDNLFPEVTFEKSPVEVELKIKCKIPEKMDLDPEIAEHINDHFYEFLEE